MTFIIKYTFIVFLKKKKKKSMVVLILLYVTQINIPKIQDEKHKKEKK